MRSKIFLTLLLFASVRGWCQGHVYIKAAPSGPQVSTTSMQFVPVPDLKLVFYQNHPGEAVISFSAEAYTTENKRMFV